MILSPRGPFLNLAGATHSARSVVNFGRVRSERLDVGPSETSDGGDAVNAGTVNARLKNAGSEKNKWSKYSLGGANVHPI